jgi:hypothetical protein
LRVESGELRVKEEIPLGFLINYFLKSLCDLFIQ